MKSSCYLSPGLVTSTEHFWVQSYLRISNLKLLTKLSFSPSWLSSLSPKGSLSPPWLFIFTIVIFLLWCLVYCATVHIVDSLWAEHPPPADHHHDRDDNDGEGGGDDNVTSSQYTVQGWQFGNIGHSQLGPLDFFSCPQQLNRWPCHSLSHWQDFYFWHYRVTLETCDLWDIWSEWWGNMTWPTFWQFFLHFFYNFWQFLQFLTILTS